MEPIKEAQAIKTGVKGTQKLDSKESKTRRANTVSEISEAESPVHTHCGDTVPKTLSETPGHFVTLAQ